jgi:peptidoglycan/LPS O-acetylase OafA/YrhL
MSATIALSKPLPGTRVAPYVVQFDALRAFAVGAVMFSHYTHVNRYEATAGVFLFFTLSGYLITGILLSARDEVESLGITRVWSLARFYARRFLRIFPLYYFVIIFGIIINLGPARRLVVWLLTYTLNIHMIIDGEWEDNFSHFWSLAVEEQFYLVWPWLILFVDRKWLIPTVLLIVAAAPLYRLSYWIVGLNDFGDDPFYIRTYIATPSCLDKLGLGALLAILNYRYRGHPLVEKWLGPLVMVSAAGIAVALRYTAKHAFFLVGDTFVSVSFCCLLYGAYGRYGGLIGSLLEWSPILYLGKISYGLYVYHPFLSYFTDATLVPILGQVAAKLFAVMLTIAVASLSWFAMEKPLNNLKRYF